MKDESVMKIDLRKVLRERLPRGYRFIPGFLVSWLERTICENQLNDLLEENRGREGADFCRGVLDSLNLRFSVENQQFLPPVENRRVVFVSNHPLGALDGMALIEYVQRRYGGQVWFVVNDLLMHVKPLAPVFLPVNKFGSQSRGSLSNIDKAFAGDDPIIVFPAGLVSRLQSVPGRKERVVRDLEWKKMFVNKSREYQRTVIPLMIQAENSMHFYKMALRRKRLGLKFNIEQIYLPQEIFRQRNRSFKVFIGNPISWQSLPPAKQAAAFAAEVRDYVYTIPLNISNKTEL